MATSNRGAPRAPALTPESLGIPGERERYAIRTRIVKQRVNALLLPAMRQHGIDMWIILSREFNPDPLLQDLGGGWAGVRSAYVFFDNGSETPDKLVLTSHELREELFSELYEQMLYGYSPEGLAPHLKRVVHERAPKCIGINTSVTLPMADGLSASLKQYLEDAIGPEYSTKLVSAELVARDFRASRLPEEFPVFRRLCEWTVAWCEEAFSERVIWPGVSTSADVYWWMRCKARELGMELEFLPAIRINRQGNPLPTNSARDPILPGDLLTLDAGFAFDLYRSDFQRTAYVLRPGETRPPQSLERAFAASLNMRDRLTANMQPGEIAHRVWDKTIAWANEHGYATMYPQVTGRRQVTEPMVGIYSHSLGNSTHDIDARIAVNWPAAYGDRVVYPLQLNRWFAIELAVCTPIPEWDGRAALVPIEEDAALTERGVEYFATPQTELMVLS
jgi:Xaa-Pro aminopeptidase